MSSQAHPVPPPPPPSLVQTESVKPPQSNAMHAMDEESDTSSSDESEGQDQRPLGSESKKPINDVAQNGHTEVNKVIEGVSNLSPETERRISMNNRRPSTMLDSPTRRSYKSMEDEIEELRKSLKASQKENEALKISLVELHREKKQLQFRADSNEVGRSGTSKKVQEVELKREKELEQLLVKAKRDKEKALKLVIGLIGRDKVLEHLTRNMGQADILDTLISSFSNSKLVENRGMRSTVASSGKKKASFVGLPVKGRSRSAERTRSIWMDVKR